MKLIQDRKYSRVNSVLLENGVEILRFLETFPVNIEQFSEDNIKYHEKYITANPDLVEWLIEEEDQYEYYKDEIEAEKRQYEEMKKSSKIHLEEKFKAKEQKETIDQTQVDSFDPTWSRKEQVKFYLDRGVESSKEIAEKIGTNPSYVQRLIKEIKK